MLRCRLLSCFALVLVFAPGAGAQTNRYCYITAYETKAYAGANEVGTARCGQRYLIIGSIEKHYLIQFDPNNDATRGYIPKEDTHLFPPLTDAQMQRLRAAEKQLQVGDQRSQNKDFAGALAEYAGALVVFRELLGEQHPETSEAYFPLGQMQDRLGLLAEAEKSLRKALEIRDATLGKQHPISSVVFHPLASICEDLNKFQDAETLRKRHVEFTKARFGEDHTQSIAAVHNLGNLYRFMGRYADAEPLLLQSLKKMEAKFGADDEAVEPFLNNYGVLQAFRGRTAAAIGIFERVLKIREKKYGTDSTEVLTPLTSLGTTYGNVGRNLDAEKALRRGLKIAESKLPADHLSTASLQFAMAETQMALGNVAEGGRFYKLSEAIREKKLGKDHLETIASVHGSAKFYSVLGLTKEALPLLERCLKVREEKLGKNHSQTATILNDFGSALCSDGQFDQGVAYLVRSLDIRRAQLGANHRDVAQSMANLGYACLQAKRYTEAEKFLRQSLAILESQLGKNHTDTMMVANNLSLLLQASGDPTEAARAIDHVLRSAHRFMSDIFPALSKIQQSEYFSSNVRNRFSDAMKFGLKHGVDNPAFASISAAWLANLKGVQHEAQAIVAQAQTTDDPKLRPLVEELQANRQALARLSLEPADGKASMERILALHKIETRGRELNQQLLTASGRQGKIPWVELSILKQNLNKNTVLIDIARFHWDSSSLFDHRYRYAAWVTPKEGNVRVVDLGMAEELDPLVAEVRKRIASASKQILTDGPLEAEKGLREKLDLLSAKLVKPLLAIDEVKNAKEWVIGPDGDLWLVPWAALTMPDGKYAIEERVLRLVIAGRDIAWRFDDTVSQRKIGTPLIVADPDFDMKRDQAAAKARALVGADAHQGNLSQGAVPEELKLGRIKRLPGTAVEAESIAPKVALLDADPPKLWVGDEALESVVKAARNPRLMVLSTHGYFLPEKAPQKPAPGEEASGVGKFYEDPLVRCGLLLAACNDQPPVGRSGEGEDGVLTGLEVLGLKLQGCELVVLSACETGLGAVRTGEGVASLRQAFHLAGAEAVLASLWSVPDRDTAQLMITMFEKLSTGADRATALAFAQRSLIQRRRDRDGAAHPFFWAAFCLSGLDMAPTGKLTNADDYMNRGRRFLYAKAYQQALADFNSAIQLDEKFSLAYNGRALVRLGKNELDAAKSDLDKAIELDPKNPIFYRNRAIWHQRRKEFKDAIADLTRGVEVDDTPNCLIERSALYRSTKQFDLSLADSMAAVTKFPTSARAWGERGLLAIDQQKWSEAIENLGKSLGLEMKGEFYLYHRARAHAKLNQLASARKDLEAALELLPTYFAAREEYARVRELLGDKTGAVQEYQRLVQQDPNAFTARRSLGVLYWDLARDKEAVEQLTEAIRLAPKDAQSHAVRAASRRELGDIVEAEKDVLKALELAPNNYVFGLIELGRVRVAQKRFDEGIESINKAIEINPNNAFAYRARVIAHRQKGDEAAARADEEKVKQLEKK